MKQALLLFFPLVSFITAMAQQNQSKADRFTFSGGIVGGLPLGEFGDTHSVGVGIELQPELRLTPQTAFYGSAGYINFFGKNFEFADYKSVGILPVLAGAKLYLSSSFFVGAKLGAGILTGDASGTAFDYQPQFGFNNKSFIVNFSYNGISKNSITLSSLLLSVLYKF